MTNDARPASARPPAGSDVAAPIEQARKTGVMTGLIGRNIAASRSPFLHQHEADAQGLRLIYKRYDFAALGLEEGDLRRVLDAAMLMGFAGFNITYPYKQVIIPLLDELSENAAKVGAVNTVALRDGRLFGENTDSLGFAESLTRDLGGARIDRVVQLGAGGAGAAVAHALLAAGTRRLACFDPDEDRAADLVGKLGDHYPDRDLRIGTDLEAEMKECDGLVNATPVGMTGHPGSPIPIAYLDPSIWVADIVYFPLETELLRGARALGCRTMNGSGMVVFQAAAAFDVFTGLKADRERMLASFVALTGG